jgi:hypothetical protein
MQEFIYFFHERINMLHCIFAIVNMSVCIIYFPRALIIGCAVICK